MLSVNQTMAQIKLTEMWKTRNTNQNPLNIKPRVMSENVKQTRSVTHEELPYTGFSARSKDTFYEDSKRVWNGAPEAIKH